MFFVEALNFTFTLFPPLPLKDGLKAQEHIVKVTFKIEAMSGMGYFFEVIYKKVKVRINANHFVHPHEA